MRLTATQPALASYCGQPNDALLCTVFAALDHSLRTAFQTIKGHSADWITHINKLDAKTSCIFRSTERKYIPRKLTFVLDYTATNHLHTYGFSIDNRS